MMFVVHRHIFRLRTRTASDDESRRGKREGGREGGREGEVDDMTGKGMERGRASVYIRLTSSLSSF